ncbi:helix-turn-helix protein [Nocardiopsis sp. Huas11]|uniref:helix-turn-helix domain-containing protein n=1 Tax=Nocardiopsis sp. Huas11 TaxID=2183912 RepID=UPI000EAF8C3D|nr:helix-turn-helix transcriptional regulator [Nocardiopsis sp. Huas11]RKS10029.1 helix-turn-helix protein [Nocardiopsis sp. Huas11]
MSKPTLGPSASFSETVRDTLTEQDISVRELARRTRFDHAYLSRVLAGKQRPSPALADAVDQALNARGNLAALAAGPPPSDDMDETGDMLEFMRRAEASDLGTGTIDVLGAAVDQLCRDYPTAPGPVLRDRSKKLLKHALGLLERRTTLAEHRELLVHVGWLSALLGCVHFDVGDRLAAETARKMAHQLGDQAGHGEIVAWAYEITAWFALSEGRYQAVVAAAEAGRAHAGVSSGGVQLLVQQAKATAKMGDPHAHVLLVEAGNMLAQLPATDQPEHHFVFDPDKLTSHGATAYTWLGWDEAAGEYASEMADRYQREYRPMRLATARLNLGILAARRGALDEAVHLGEAAFESERRSGALTSWARGLLSELEGRYQGERLVVDYRERLALETTGDR